jgi:hypothetical protein
VAEQGCLLSSYPDKIGIGGSNPPLSAIAVNACKTKRTHEQLTDGQPTLCVRAFV